jgi:hypothetical protein
LKNEEFKQHALFGSVRRIKKQENGIMQFPECEVMRSIICIGSQKMSCLHRQSIIEISSRWTIQQRETTDSSRENLFSDL